MESFFWFMYILCMIELATIIFGCFVIFKGVGFRNMFSIFKVRFKKRKGWGFVRMLHITGYPELIPVKFEASQIKPFKDKPEAVYNIKKYCIYENEYGCATIDYREDDADPIDYRTGISTVTNPKTLGNLQKRIITAENMVDPGMEWLKNNWKKLGFGVLIAMGIVGYVLITLMGTNTDLSKEIAKMSASCAKNTIINATTLGK